MAFEGGFPTRRKLLVLAAAPTDGAAQAIAQELQRLGWETIVTDQVGQYAYEAYACIVLLLSPEAPHSAAVQSALEARPANMIPLVIPTVSPPYARWAGPPVPVAASLALTAQSINDALGHLDGATSPRQAAMGQYVPGGQPVEPIPPSQPVYPSQPAYPQQPGYPTNEPTYPATAAGGQAFYAGNQPTMPGMQPTMQYPGQPYPGGPGVAPQPNAPRRNRAAIFGIIGGVVLLACVLACLGGLYFTRGVAGKISTSIRATLTARPATATATASMPVGFASFTDPGGYYRLNAPTAWKATSTSTYSGWLSSSPIAEVAIASASGSPTSSDIQNAIGQTLKSFSTGAGGSGSYTTTQGPTTVSLAGESWTQEAADVGVKGVTLHSVVMGATHNGRFYIILYVAPKDTFDTTDTQSFQPMLNSFTFLQ